MSTERKPEEGQKGYKEPVTHILVPLNQSLPVPVDARLIRRTHSRYPNDKTRPGEERTIPPENTPKFD